MSVINENKRECHMDVDYREMDRLLEQYCRQQSEDPGDDLVATEFTSGSLPPLRENAIRNKLSVDDYNGTWMWGWSVTKLLFEALHDDYRRSDWKPRYLWRHQQFSLFKTLDASRGFSIDKEMLLKAASIYLSHPEIRTSKLDWLFLDSIVFLELDLYGDHFFKQRGGAGTNWAAVFATEKNTTIFC